MHCCEAARSARLDPSDPAHVQHQLRAEGHKRLASFAYEWLFNRQLHTTLGASGYSTGWILSLQKTGPPRYGFRLLGPQAPWYSRDEQFAALLMTHRCPVICIKAEGSAFLARLYNDAGAWSPLDDLMTTLTGHTHPAATPRNYRHRDATQQDAALTCLGRLFAPDDWTRLSLMRTLVNCYLYPWLGRQPMDLDALVDSVDGVCCVEFKRKYPAADGCYGLDEHPHGLLADWLAAQGQPMRLVILNDPLWDKHADPLHLLNPSSGTALFADWMGYALNEAAFASGTYHTNGADSGMHGGRRKQRRFRSEVAAHLGTGLYPEHLATFLAVPSAMAPQDMRAYLRQRRDAARAAVAQQAV